ncbi:MAG: hypothetical protein IPJ88_05935 [Myxococcales bacterium]|nr:MAG: hypothetical protein IPJ88_05935 [Myxococcales bacterium]
MHEDGFTLRKHKYSWCFYAPDGEALLNTPAFPREGLQLVKSLTLPAPKHNEALMPERYQHRPDYVTAVQSV